MGLSLDAVVTLASVWLLLLGEVHDVEVVDGLVDLALHGVAALPNRFLGRKQSIR